MGSFKEKFPIHSLVPHWLERPGTRIGWTLLEGFKPLGKRSYRNLPKMRARSFRPPMVLVGLSKNMGVWIFGKLQNWSKEI